MVVKRDRLPKPSDRRADFLDAWAEPDGRLGIEVNDHGTIHGLLLQVDAKGLDALAEAVEKLRGQPAEKPLPSKTKPRRKR